MKSRETNRKIPPSWSQHLPTQRVSNDQSPWTWSKAQASQLVRQNPWHRHHEAQHLNGLSQQSLEALRDNHLGKAMVSHRGDDISQRYSRVCSWANEGADFHRSIQKLWLLDALVQGILPFLILRKLSRVELLFALQLQNELFQFVICFMRQKQTILQSLKFPFQTAFPLITGFLLMGLVPHTPLESGHAESVLTLASTCCRRSRIQPISVLDPADCLRATPLSSLVSLCSRGGG